MINKKTRKNKGFTIIETLIAVLIMTISITSLMTVVTSSLFAAKYTRDKVTATYLLQETVDYIRNDRDTSVFLQRETTTDDAWNSFKQKYANCTEFSTYSCYIDVVSSAGIKTLSSCNLNNTDCNLYYNKDATGAFYNYNNDGEKSNYKRRIVVKTPNPDEMDVEVIVSWMNGGLPKSMSLKTSLLNW